MITISIDHCWTHCEWEDHPSEFELLQWACSYFVKGAERSPTFQEGFWDGTKTLFKKRRSKPEGYFPTGLLSHVLSVLSSTSGNRIHVVDKRVFYNTPSFICQDNIVGVDLRDYQINGGNAGLYYKCGIIKMPTAAGKTLTMLGLISTLDLPTLWLAPEGALARQTQKTLSERTGEEVGLYGFGSKTIRRWTVASPKSLIKHKERLKDWLSQILVLVLDECHHGSCNTWYDTAMSIPAMYRFGCSATPFERSDEAWHELVGCTGPLIFVTEAEDIKEHLSRPHIEMIHMPQDRSFARISDHHEAYEKGIVEYQLRNDISVERAMRCVMNREPGILFVARIAHGKYFLDRLREEIGCDGLHQFVEGGTPQHIRDEYYNKLRQRKLYILIAMDRVAGEGQDIPAVRRVIVSGAMKAGTLVKQRIGRGMRPEDELTQDGWRGRVDVHDFIDNHYFPLLKWSYQRIACYRSVGAIVTENHEFSQR